MILWWLFKRLRAYWQRRAGEPATPLPDSFRPTRVRAQPRGKLGLVLHQARYDLIAFSRNIQAVFFTLILPILFLVIFVSIFGNHRVPPGVKAATYFVPGLAALGVIAASFVNLVISITAQREMGVLKRRRATPVPAWALIAGRTLTAMTVSLTVLTVLLVIGRFGFGVHLRTGALPGIALTAVVGAITFCVLGYALSTAIHNQDAAQPMTQAIMLPLYFISGVFVVNSSLPSWLRHVASVFPVQHLADGLHRAFDPAATGVGIVWTDLGVLGIWLAIGLAVALVRFSWLPKAASA